MNRKAWLFVGLTFLFVALGLVAVLFRCSSSPAQQTKTTEAQDSDRAASLPPTASIAPVASTIHDRKLRDEVRNRIYANNGESPPEPGGVRRSAGVAPTTPPGPGPQGSPGPNLALSLDGQYIREVVREDFYPMARQCYESALAANPKLGGKIILDFTIVGDAKIGGIVESAKIDPDSTIQDPKLLECFTESLLSLAFKPPTKGGTLTVKYPFALTPDEPPEAGQR